MNHPIFRIPPAPDFPPGTHALINKPVITEDDRGWRYAWEVLLQVPGEDSLTLGGAWFRSNRPIRPLSGAANAALVGSILPLMMTGVPVHVEGGVSPRLHRNLGLFQAAFASWYPGLKQVAIEAMTPDQNLPNPPADPEPPREGVLFSLGVDSWFSVLQHRDTVQDLVFIDGFDLTSEQSFARQDVRQAAQEAARAVGRPLVVLETNLRDWLDRWIDWLVPHGSLLGAAVLLLEGHLSKVWFPSNVRAWEPVPSGSNPFTDPLYSTEHLRSVYDGGGTHRVGKIARLLEDEVAMKNLRVCWSGTRGRLNCGECPKCVRTMATLHLLGALERAEWFQCELHPDMIRKLPMTLGLKDEGKGMLRIAKALGLEQDPIALAVSERFRRNEVEQLMTPDTGALTTMTDPESWAAMARLDRQGLAEDFMTHAPGRVNEVLAPAVDRVPREVFKLMWQKDRDWLKREIRQRTGRAKT